MAYGVKKNPEKYLDATLRMCREREKDEVKNPKRKIRFLPTRERSVLCHSKFDTETTATLFVPWKIRVEARKRAADRKYYNDLVWDQIIAVEKDLPQNEGLPSSTMK